MQLSKLNPDWQVAQLHGISTFPGLVNPDKPKNENLICPCCLNSICKDKAPLCENSKQLQFLGFGFPLFYVFLKYCIMLLLVAITSYNAIALYWAISENETICHQLQEGCTSIMVELASIQETVSNGQVLVRVCSFMIQLGILLYIRDLITKTRNYYDQRTCSLSDYSLIVSNLPKRKGTRRNLLKFLEKCYDKQYSPCQVTFLPDYQKFYELEEHCSHIIKEMKSLINDQDKNKQRLEELQRQLQKNQREIHQYCDSELKLQENDQCITEKLIFSCQSEDDKENIIDKFGDISEQKLREVFQIPPEDECNIDLDEAPEPKQINWQHINYPEHKRVGRMILGWLMTITFLGIITAIFFFMLTQKSHLIEHSIESHSSSYSIAVFLVYVAIISVILFNKFIMGMVLHMICDFQLHPTTAQLQFHFAVKYSVGMFFTTALMTLAVEDLQFGNFYTHPYGVIEQETVMFAMNAFFVPLIWLINPWQIHVLARRKLNYGRKDLTQKQANKIMQNIQYNMGKRYAQIIEIMWFTYLYSSLIPLGAFFSAIGLSLYYWIDKYNLLRRSSVNSNISGELSLFSMKLLDFTLICKPIGQIIFDSQMRDSYCISSVIMCSVGFLYLILPIDNFLEFFHPEKFKNQEKHYQDVQKNFKETYQTLHPIFSLKQENQQKMFEAFRMIETAMESSVQVVCIKPSQSNNSVANDQQCSPNPLKDATNILQSLFKKHDYYNFKEREKQTKE